jgi:hypothetical protein
MQFLTSRRLIRLKKLFDPPEMEQMPRVRFTGERIDGFCERYSLKDLSRRVAATIQRAESAKAAGDQQQGGSIDNSF